MGSTSSRWFSVALGAICVVSSAAACSSGGKDKHTSGDGGPLGDGINDTGQGAGTGADTGLPCNVQQVLENRCIGCHLRDSSLPLLNYDDLMKPAPSDPATNMAHKALERMRSDTDPMPPPPAQRATFNEIGAIQGWIDNGTPRGESCTTSTSGGTTYNGPFVCTSGKTWTSGDTKSSLMHPGGPCITCHTMKGGPGLTVAGTIYPTAHEPNDCNGVNGVQTPITVTLTDVNGGLITMNVNSAGNFFTYEEIFPPYQVRIFDGTKDRVMDAPLTAGDCNSCHTPGGVNGAPGRIQAP